MLGLKRHLKSIVSSAAPGLLRRGPTPDRPNLSDAAFFQRLRSSHPELAEARARFDNGELKKAKGLVVAHFRRRRSPAFFVDNDRIPELVATVTRAYPHWRSATLRRAESDIRNGLRVYSTRAAPLAERFNFRRLALGPGEDSLHVKKAHRFGFLPRLALSSLYGGPDMDVLSKIVKTWIRKIGRWGDHAAYSSNLVVTYRLLAMSWTLAFVQAATEHADDVTVDIEFDILKILCADASVVAPRIGQSVPNNHLLADGFLGWFLDLIYPEFDCVAGLGEKGAGIWLRELDRQIYEDGTVFEHSTHYLELDTELAVAYVLLSRRNDLEVPDWISERLGKMLAFQAAISGPDAVVLHVGDAAEDPLLPLDDEAGWAPAAMRELYRALFNDRAAPAPESEASVERAFWLLGGALAPTDRQATMTESFAAFPHGGFYVFPDDDQTARLVFRTGPPPELPIAIGHMHADLMGIYLNLSGVPVVVDPGTYTYRAESRGWPSDTPPWRRHFAGPYAHNGLSIAGSDPLGQHTLDFRRGDSPTRVRTTRIHVGASMAMVEAETVGEPPYAGHKRGVIHVIGAYWLIYDVLPPGIRPREASLGLQLAATARVTSSTGALQVAVGDRHLSIPYGETLSVQDVVAGRTSPPGGWVSAHYGERIPAPNIRFAFADDADSGCFVLCPTDESDNALRVDSLPLAGPSLGFRLVSSRFEDLIIVNRSPTEEASTLSGIRFRGALAWIRTEGGSPVAVRWTDGKALSWSEKGLDIQAETTVVSVETRLAPSGPDVIADPDGGIRIRWP